MPAIPLSLDAPLPGGSFAIAVQQSTHVDTDNVTAFRATATIGVDLIRSPTEFAPESVKLMLTSFSGFGLVAGDPVNGHDEHYTDLDIRVDFGEPGAVYTAPSRYVTLDRNVEFGPLTGHVYRQPGTYTIRMWATSITTGRSGYWSQTITVRDWENERPNSDTVYVSTASDLSWTTPLAGHGGQFATIYDAIEARKPNEYTRIVCQSGLTEAHRGGQISVEFELGGPAGGRKALHIHTHDGNAYNMAAPVSSAGTDFLFRLWGHRTQTLLDSELVMQDIHVPDGNWDVATETGNARVIAFGGHTSYYAIQHILFDRCLVQNCQAGFSIDGQISSPDDNTGAVLNDCHAIDCRDIGMWVSAPTMVLRLGCNFYRSDTASMGGPKVQDPWYMNHGGGRNSAIARQRYACLSCYDYPRSGWDSAIDPIYQTGQPCDRFNTQGQAGSLANYQQNFFVCSFYGIHRGRQNDDYRSPHEQMVVQRNRFVAASTCGQAIIKEGGGLLATHNIFDIGNNRQLAGYNPCFVSLSPINPSPVVNGPSDPTVYDNRVLVANNTIVNHRTPANDPFTGADYPIVRESNGTAYTKVIVRDNVHVQANLPVPETADGPLSAQVVSTVPNQVGYFHNRPPAIALIADQALPADTAQRGAPLPGAGALGGATHVWSSWDMHGRPTTGRDRGAFEQWREVA